MTKIEDLINLYHLQPHPEGGFFKETYRSQGIIPQKALGEFFQGDRAYSTAIYFLLPQGAKSHLHRIKSDEIWHFYLGGALTIVEIFPSGQVEEIILGTDVKAGEKLQHVVPAGCWFGAYPNSGSPFSFVGCTVAPGFDFADFEMAQRSDLLGQFPQHKEMIERLINL